MAYVFGDYQAKRITSVGVGGNLVDRAGAGIHPMFGIVMVDNNGSTQGSQQALQEVYEDIVPRELGIASELVKNNKILTGLSAPGTYLNRKNAALQQIGADLSIIYRQEYIKAYNKGKSVEEAKKWALKYCKAIEEMKLKEHEEDFPTELTREISNRFKRRNENGDLSN